MTVQLSSYHLLQRVVEKHVADLVVEAELDAEDKLDIRLPTALVSALGDKPTEDEPAEVSFPSFAKLETPRLTELLSAGYGLPPVMAPHVRLFRVGGEQQSGLAVDNL